MTQNEISPALPKPLRAYIAVAAIAGAAWLAYLIWGMEWDRSTAAEVGLFTLLILVAGSFPLPVAPKVKADVTTAVLFGAALLLEPGAAGLAASVGVAAYTFLIRFWGDKLRLPWYKYPFNAGSTALYVGLGSYVFHELAAENELLTPAVAAAAAVIYMANTALVTGAASLQMGINPLRFWWMGTRENGPAELSLLAFGFLGAVVYEESAWTVVALFLPAAIIYMAFSRLAQANARLESLQGQIATNAKLASVGAIALDMAHQIKNPLAVMLGRLETIKDRVGEKSPNQRDLDSAMKAGWRIAELTENFTSIGHKKLLEIDVPELLNEAFGMAHLSNRTRIETRWEYQEDLPKVLGNPVLLREALSNIFSNSMEAVVEGGLITINASWVNGSVVVRISDDGEGIPQQVMDHLFEPFQSTKPNGTGLGIFAAKHILEMHRGSLEIETERGRGTSVTVTLPALPSLNGGATESQQGDNDIQRPAQSQ